MTCINSSSAKQNRDEFRYFLEIRHSEAISKTNKYDDHDSTESKKIATSNGSGMEGTNSFGIGFGKQWNDDYNILLSIEKINSENNKSLLSLVLKYHSGNPVINTFERVSKPGRRIFSSANGLPKINNGLGIAIVSTPKGVMTDLDARKQRVGGEIICKVF